MSSVNRIIVAMLAAAALAVGFWVLLLSPKREEAVKLERTVSSLKSSLALHQQEVQEALLARRQFPADYGQLVVLGKAVPADDDTASLLVQINRIAKRAEVGFAEIKLTGSAEEAPAPTPAPEAEAASSGTPESAAPVAAPTEAAAATMPLGASIGPAGLAVMPYSLKFTGDFFRFADFIKGLDKLVKTVNSKVSVGGRLVTIDGFSLGPQDDATFPYLEANFAVTTYLVPEGQGVTAGATPTAPSSSLGAPVAAVTGGAP